MTRNELRVYLQSRWCGCGSPEDACAALLRLLRLHPAYEHGRELKEWLPDNGVRHLLLYKLADEELTEHGGSVGAGWLSVQGEAVRDALAREEEDGFETLMLPACVHGFADDDPADFEHDCMAFERARCDA